MQFASPTGELALVEETLELYHAFYRRFVQDPALFAEGEPFTPYRYQPEAVEAKFRRRQEKSDQKCFIILLDREVIGEVVLRHIDPDKRCCELGICMVNDQFKNRGYGTRAEGLALRHGFEELGMETITAKTLPGNTRSQHVLEKIGFHPTGQEGTYRYYAIRREQYLGEETP